MESLGIVRSYRPSIPCVHILFSTGDIVILTLINGKGFYPVSLIFARCTFQFLVSLNFETDLSIWSEELVGWLKLESG